MLKSVVSALIGVPLLLSCAKGDGTYAGKQADPRKGTQCSLCTVDPPHLQVDCAKEEEGTEFLPVTIWDFDQSIATNLYMYNDASGLFSSVNKSWEPETEAEDWCIGRTGNNVFHYQAGPFTNWGGAIGRHFKCLNGSTVHGGDKLGTSDLGNVGCGSDPDGLKACDREFASNVAATPGQQDLAWSVCPQRDKQVLESADREAGRAGQEEYLLGMALDLSEWDGISFWARRSSDSQAGIRVSIGDKFTDDDMSYLQYHVNPDDKRACERNIECGCNGNSPCYAKTVAEYLGQPPTGEPSMRCWDLPPALHRTSSMTDADMLLPPECGQSMCTNDATGSPRIFDALQHGDEQRRDTTCQQYRFNGGIEGLFCYKADGQRPQENSQLCGDHWAYPVYLSTEWQFYKVPFTSLLQQGWAKKFDKLDVSTATMIRFQWSTGWMDFWLDDVRVYRDKLNTAKR